MSLQIWLKQSYNLPEAQYVILLSQRDLEDQRMQHRQETLKHIAYINKRNCDLRPVYGHDLLDTVCVQHEECKDKERDCWRGVGSVHCYNVHNHCRKNPHHPEVYWNSTEVLGSLVHTTEQYLDELQDILSRYASLQSFVKSWERILHLLKQK